MLAVGLRRGRLPAYPGLGQWVSFVPAFGQAVMSVGCRRSRAVRRTHQIHFQEVSPIPEVRINHVRGRQEVARH